MKKRITTAKNLLKLNNNSQYTENGLNMKKKKDAEHH